MPDMLGYPGDLVPAGGGSILLSCRLADKRCLIVGGTSGIGLASAQRFLEESAAVVIAGPDPDQGDAALAELRKIGPVHYVHCDATQPDQVARLLQQTLAALGGLDVLFHVAGFSGRPFGDGPLHECSDAGWQATMGGNLTSVFLTNRATVRHFLERRQPGTILNVGSVLGLAPSPHFFDAAAYTAAKGGIVALSRLAAARYALDKIRVNVLAPGLTDTPMATRALHDHAIRRFLVTKQPLAAGPGAASDCAEAAVFLCSDEARLITGAVLPVDSGWCVSEGQFS
jgi:NAD(P)-dependent dehydrogenase (short-subunit alcohol dehydrogenase family)